MNFLEAMDASSLTANDMLIATKSAASVGGDQMLAQCPTCGQFRPGFLIYQTSLAEQSAHGAEEWACDGDRSRWLRMGV